MRVDSEPGVETSLTDFNYQRKNINSKRLPTWNEKTAAESSAPSGQIIYATLECLRLVQPTARLKKQRKKNTSNSLSTFNPSDVQKHQIQFNFHSTSCTIRPLGHKLRFFFQFPFGILKNHPVFFPSSSSPILLNEV